MSQEKQYAKRTYGIIRIFRKILFHIAMKMPFLKAEFRAKIHRAAGVNIINPKQTFIGYDVLFDDLYPEDITVEEGTFLTIGCRILAHFIDPSQTDYNHMKRGKVHIGKDVFLGINVVIAKPVTIGDGAVIGANSVVIKDIPPYTIWGGNPAKQIGERNKSNNEHNNNSPT